MHLLSTLLFITPLHLLSTASVLLHQRDHHRPSDPAHPLDPATFMLPPNGVNYTAAEIGATIIQSIGALFSSHDQYGVFSKSGGNAFTPDEIGLDSPQRTYTINWENGCNPGDKNRGMLRWLMQDANGKYTHDRVVYSIDYDGYTHGIRYCAVLTTSDSPRRDQFPAVDLHQCNDNSVTT